MTKRRKPTGAGELANRSRITNGTKLLPGVHSQSVWARYMRDVHHAMVNHLGGDDRVSQPQRLACRHIAVLAAEMAHVEDKIGRMRMAGEEPDDKLLDLYCRLGNAKRRFIEMVGLKPELVDVTPDLADYLAQRAATKASSEADTENAPAPAAKSQGAMS
jgi:hypothetical protein